MLLNLASLNVRELRDPSKCARLLSEFSNLSVDVVASDSLHLRSRGSGAGGWLCRSFSAGDSLLIGRSLNVDVDLFFAGDRGRLFVAMKSFAIRVIAIYVPNYIGQRRSLFRRLEPFLGYSKRIVLVGDWNAILHPKLDKAGRGASRLYGCESSLVDFMARFDLVDRSRLDHPGSEMWMWIDSSPSVRLRSYLDWVLVWWADSDFASCPTFFWIGLTDNKLVRVSPSFENKPSLPG